MEKSEYPRFVRAIAAMAATFRAEATEAIFQGYKLGLADLAIEAIERAVTRAIRECRFLPTVAELRDLAGELSPADRAIVAWDSVMAAVVSDGFYRSVTFDDPVINAAIRSMGGWEGFNERLDREEEKWLRRDFERLYVSFARSGVSPEAAAPLIGFHDRENALHGYHDAIRPPKRIATGLPPHPAGVVPALPSQPQKRLPNELITPIGAMPD